MHNQELTVVHRGRTLAWEGFCTGPGLLCTEELERISRRLLGTDLAGAKEAAGKELLPFGALRGEVPAIVLGTASTLKGCFEADVAQLALGRSPDDFTAYNEARAVYLAAPGDLVVGRGEPWRQAVAASEAVPVEVPELHYYYLTHALLAMAVEAAPGRPSAPLEQLVRQLSAAPETVVRLFAIDAEARVLLLWLKRAAGLERLRVDANGPEIAERWNRKTTLYPTVEDALEVPAPRADDAPETTLCAEAEATAFHREFGVLLPRLPGYSVSRAGADEALLRRRVHTAARLLGERYGLELGCFKPAEALTGSRIRMAVPLTDGAALDALARQAMETEEDYVLEAHTHYLRHRVPGYEFILAPSAHVVAGRPAEGGTVQITRGSVWEGSVYVDEETCARFDITPAQFRAVREGMATLHGAFRGAGRDLGFVKGGVDFAIARLGGRFGGRPVVAMQDLNLSSNGAEYVRAFLAEARDVLGRRQGVYAATKVVRPAAETDLKRLEDSVGGSGAEGWARAITSVAGRWGLIGVAAPCPRQAAQRVLELEQRLHRTGLLRTSVWDESVRPS
ncbi:hypothetical protein AQI95_25410 [Streptomyces yokosukanensis]|uniref:ATP-grasp domain-containing protein n=1 Tax=Streptomyces yokosukanensis TaxID=67386 RepID=A0A101P0W0_9ACTN|nr:hypothetical protein [Streptomyces yokosukanensis]KUN02869.1 hypothetical protein AQI95_25410 [Streptomyces yokosukanensis]